MKDEGNINMYKYTRKRIISKGVGLNYKKNILFIFSVFIGNKKILGFVWLWCWI